MACARRDSAIIRCVNILLADDHALIREGLRTVLRGFDQEVACFEAIDGATTIRSLAEHPEIDLVLLDRRLPDCDGIELMQRLLERHPALPIVMLSAEFDADIVTQAIQFGAAGFIPKTSVTTVLVSALKLILAGGVYVPPEVLRREPRAPAHAHDGVAFVRQSPNGAAHAGIADADTPNPGLPIAEAAHAGVARVGLTGRQVDVLALLMEGKSNKQISRDLDLAEATVKVHVRSILRALDANSRTEAVVAASRLGLSAENIRDRATPGQQ